MIKCILIYSLVAAVYADIFAENLLFMETQNINRHEPQQ